MATIKNIIQTIFQSQGSDRSIRELNNLGRAQTRLGQSSASAGRAFSAQASGLGGLVAAYAGAAATTFALQQAFAKLADAARAAQTLDGLTSLAATSGANASKILQSVQEATKGQLTLVQAAQQANLSLSAGFNTDQIERLAGVATKASRALGRDLTDAYTRVVRGSAKMETELLDELGIYTKIDPATRAYAAAIGKTVSQLSEYERRQAFVNAVIEEGESKFSSINTTIPTSAEKIEAFGATVVNIATQFGILLADVIAPLADFLANNVVASISAVGLAFSLVAAKGVSLLKASLTGLAIKTTEVAVSSENVARKMLGLTTRVLAANDAIKAINVNTLRLSEAQKAELVSLQQTATTRALSNAEMAKAKTLINMNEAAIRSETAALQSSLATSNAKVASLRAEMEAKQAAYNRDRTNTVALQEARRARGAYGAAVRANNAIVATNTPIIAANNAALTANAAATTAATAATTGFLARAAGGVSLVIKGVGAALAATSALVLGFVGFISIATIVVGFFALITLGIAKLLGKERELTAFITTVFGNLKEAVFGLGDKNTRNVFLGIATDTLEKLEAVDSRLKNLDTFTFKKKVFGVEVEITKTKEDIINEVESALADVSNLNVFEAFTMTSPIEALKEDGFWKQIGQGIGFAIGVGISSVSGIATGGVGIAWSVALTAAFTQLGAQIGAAFDNSFVSESEAIANQLKDVDVTSITRRYSSELAGLTQEQQNFAILVIDTLAKSYDGQERFNLEARLALDTQAKITIEQIKQADAVETLSVAISQTGKQVSELADIFNISYNEVLKLGEAIFSIRDSEPLRILITTDVNRAELNQAIEDVEDLQTNIRNSIRGNSRAAAQDRLDLAAIGSVQSLIYEDAEQGAKVLENLFNLVVRDGKTATEVATELASSTIAAERQVAEDLSRSRFSYEALRKVLVGTTQDTGNFAIAAADAAETLTGATLRAASNITTLNNSILQGAIDLETFEQQAGAVAAALAEARAAQAAYNRAIEAAEAQGLKDDVEQLIAAYVQSRAENSRTVESLEAQLEAINNLKQGIIDTAAVLTFLKNASEKTLSALDFEVAVAAAAGDSNAGLIRTIELVNTFSADAAFAKQELDSLSAALSRVPNTVLEDSLKQVISGTTQTGLVELAEKYENLIELNGKLFAYSGGDPFAPGALTELPLLTQDAADAMEKYEAAIAAVDSYGQQLVINATAETTALKNLVKELDRRIIAEKDALTLSQIKVDISEAELELAREIRRLQSENSGLERELAITNSIFDTNMMLEEAKIKTNETTISYIENQQKLAEATAQRELASIRQRQAEEAALLEISNKVLNTRLEYLRAATDLELLSSSVITGGPENIASYLESVYEKQRQLTDVQVELFRNQLTAYNQDYRNRLELINQEKADRTAEIDREIRIANIRKDSANIELTNAEATLANIVENNRVSLARLRLQQSIAKEEIAGQQRILTLEEGLITQKADVDKRASDAAIALEAEKSLATGRALLKQYELLEAQGFIFDKFIKNYTTLLNEAARQQDPAAVPLDIQGGKLKFDEIKANLLAQMKIVSDRYEELQRLAREAIDDQAAIAQNEITDQAEALQARVDLNERFFERELQLERNAAIARVRLQQAEIAATKAVFDSLGNELLVLAEQRSEAEIDATTQSEEAFTAYINNVIGLYGQLQNAVISLTSSIASQNVQLSSLSASISASNASIEARRVELGFTRQINDIQGDIAVRQSEINLLKAQEAESAGNGISAQERLLTLKQQEINFQAELNNLQAESTKRRLEASIESAQSSLSLFEADTSIAGLAGSIAALTSIFVQQQELVELQRSQAEEAYRRELELVEIDRALLEEEKASRGGAAAASAAVLEAERALLLDQQNIARLELDRDITNQKAAVLNIASESRLQVEQAKIDGARARAQAAANRAELDSIKLQADVFSAFLNGIKTEFPAVFNKILEAMGKAPIDLSLVPITDIDLGASLGLDEIDTFLSRVDDQIADLYGNLDGVSGRVFENLNANATLSVDAAREELRVLEQRKAQLQTIQANELAAFEANARAQAAGSAMELAEIDKREKELQLRIANATDRYARDMQEASKAAADSVRNFVTAAVDTFGKVIVAQKQARVNALLAEEEQLKSILTFQTEALNEAQSAASNALQEEISLREELKAATESLIESQTSYLESLGGEGNVTEASKQFIDTLLDQKQAIFDLQRATRSRIAADSRLSSLESVQAQLTDSLTLKTSQRIEAEASLEKTQERLALITKLVSGEIGNFIKSLGSLGSSLAGLGGGGSFGQVFSNLIGFQDAIASFANVGATFAAASGRQLAAANTQVAAANAINNAAATLAPATSLRPVMRPDVAAGGAAAATGQSAAASGLTFSSIVSTAFAGAGVGSLIGALTGDTSWASTIGGAIGSTVATVFAGSKFVSAVSVGIAKVATSVGFAANAGASIAAFATPLVFAAFGALIIGALFGRKKKIPSASIKGTLTGEGFDTTSATGRNISGKNIDAIESIPEQVFAGFLDSFSAAGLKFRDSVDVVVGFYNGSFNKVETTFASGLTTTATNIGKEVADVAKELERQFFRGLAADSFEVSEATFARSRIQQALKTFGELEDLDQKTSERFIEAIEYARQFDSIVRGFLSTSLSINDIFDTIDFAARSFTENKLNEYLTELNRAAKFFGDSSEEYTLLEKSIRSNALSLLGLAETADGSLISTRELTSELNAGAIAIRNIIAETTAFRSTLTGLESVFEGLNVDQVIDASLTTRISEFINDFGDSISLAIDVLQNPARLVLVDLEKFIVNGTERIRQSIGIYDQLLVEQANGITISGETINRALKNTEDSVTLLGLELEAFVSSVSDKAQLQAIIDSAEAIDSYAGAIARSAAESRLAEINEIERTQATQQFNKVSREFSKRLRELTGAAGGLSIGGEGVTLLDVLEAFGTTEIDESARQFKSYLDSINEGSDISSNFTSAIDFLNERFDNGETDSLRFVSSLELLQRVTLETVDSIGQLADAYENTLQQIADAFNSSRQDLLDSIDVLSNELISLVQSVSDKTQEILGIYDDAFASVTETGNAIFDLRDAAKDAFTSAADAVAEFEKANKLSGKTAAQLRTELETVNASIAGILNSPTFDLASFIDLSNLTAAQSSIQRELKRQLDTEEEYAKLLSDRTTAEADLAFVEASIVGLSGKLNDSRSTESKFTQEVITAVEEFTTAETKLANITDILAENNFSLNKARIDENDAVVKLNKAITDLNRDSIALDALVTDILGSADSTLREAFIEGAISNLAGELATLDETARAARIAEVTLAAGTAFDSLVPLASSIAGLTDRQTITDMNSVTTAITGTFASLISVFTPESNTLVSNFATQVSKFSDISTSIASVEGLRTQIDNLSTNSTTSAEKVNDLVTDLAELEKQISTLTGPTGVDSLSAVFGKVVADIETAWGMVELGLPDAINLNAISVAEEGGLKELRTIATNSANAKIIDAAGLNYKTVALAEGGYVSGPGTSTSDSVPARLSNGEFVLKASSVQKLGVGLLNSLNSSGDISSVIAREGRFGDTNVAHINNNEARLLKRLGGSGTRNPSTGMLEFFGGASSGASAYGGLFNEEEASLLYRNYMTGFATDAAVEAQSNSRASINSTNAYMQANISRLLNPTDMQSGIEVTSFAPAVGNPGSQNRYSLPSTQLFGDMLADNYSATAQMLAVRGIAQNSIGTANNFIGASKSKTATSLVGRNNATLTSGLPDGFSNFKGISESSLSWLSGLKESSANQVTTLNSFKKAVDEQNKANSLFFDFYMLKDTYNKIPKTVKASQGALEAAEKRESEGTRLTNRGFGIDVDGDRINDSYVNWQEDEFGNQVGNMTVRDANKFDRAVEKAANSVKDSWNSFWGKDAGGGLVSQSGALHSLSKVKGSRDSVPTMLEPGEFVLRKAAVERMGLDTAIRLNSTGNAESDVNVEVNVINNGSPVTPTIQQTRRENGKIVVDVILEDVRNNGPIRQAMKGIR